MQVDWMFLTYLIVGFFAILGFFRGWWKEAVTIFVLASLMILLQRPDWAELIINLVNQVIAAVWQILVGLSGLALPQEPFQIDPTSGGAWVVILILLLGTSSLITYAVLPGGARSGRFYAVRPMGRLLGLLLGGFNGYLVVSLIREYLDGRALPGRTPPDTEVVVTGGSSFGPPTGNVAIQAVNMPNLTVLDSFIPWLIIAIGFLIFFAAIKTRVGVQKSNKGRKIVFKGPYGYESMPRKDG